MNWTLFASTFVMMFLAEIPDKTAFATLIMASEGEPFAVFIGVALAFLIQSLVAIAFGRVIGLMPERWVHLLAGALFIGFAIYSWTGSKKQEAFDERALPHPKGNIFLQMLWKSFLVIFIAEWGDLTQLATASLAAKYPQHLGTIFIAATSALWTVTAIAVFFGNRLSRKVNVKLLKKISAVIFATVGVYFIVTALKT